MYCIHITINQLSHNTFENMIFLRVILGLVEGMENIRSFRVRVRVRVRIRGVKAADIRESDIHVYDVYGHGVCVQVRRVFAG